LEMAIVILQAVRMVEPLLGLQAIHVPLT